MRENNRFRGINKVTGKMIFGDRITHGDNVFIVNEYATEVIPETVGQRICLADFDGYEGDIVETSKGRGAVAFNCLDGCYYIQLFDGGCYYFNSAVNGTLRIVGNIWENPELMGGEKV